MLATASRKLVSGLLGLGLTAALVGAAAPTAQAADYTWDAPGWGWQVHSDGFDGTAVEYTSPHGVYLVPSQFYNPAAMLDQGEFQGVHASYGGGRGSLGYPKSGVVSQTWSEYGFNGGYQVFERGVIYSSTHGDFALLNSNPITQAYNRAGGGGGVAGYPIGNPVQQGPGWWYQEFYGATIYSSPHGTYVVSDDADLEHLYQGGGGGALGYPTGPRRSDGPGYTYQTFERGIIYCNPSTRCWSVKGGFVGAHASQGGGRGWLGYPSSNEYYYASGGFWIQTFERDHFIAIYTNGRVEYY